MVGLLVTGLGLLLETSVIVVLGRQATRPYERDGNVEAGLVRRR